MTHAYPPIDRDDIKAGDLIRFEYAAAAAFDLTATEYAASRDGQAYMTGRSAGSHYLIDRPRKIVHAKGTTLWFNKELSSGAIKRGDCVTVSNDFHEGDPLVVVDWANYPRGQRSFHPSRFTTTPPAPAVEIPETPTLGTLVFKSGKEERGIWWRNGTDFSGALIRGYFSDSWTLENVTSFTPLHALADDETAVKTAAVEALRGANIWAQLNASPVAKNIARLDAILTFLATIDSADESS